LIDGRTKLCDERLEAELTAAEIMLVDLDGTTEEVAGALGPAGYERLMLQADRDQQVAEAARWLSCDSGDTLH